jgi:signal transduction histidine kinase
MTADRWRLASPVAAASESALVLAGVVYRAYGLSQVIIPLCIGWSKFGHRHLVLWFAVAIVAENVVLLTACGRLRRLPGSLITIDLAWNIVALLIGAWLTWVHAGETWINFMYPYTVIGAVLIGFAFSRYITVFLATCGLAAGYAVADTLTHHDAAFAVIPNTLGYYANTLAAFLVAWYLRRLGRGLDASRADTLARTEAAAKERERARHARMLHDRVLQTLETLGRGDWVVDVQFRRQIAAEAAWLRALVEGGDPHHSGDLLTELRRLVQQRAETGLHVDLSTAQLRESGNWRARLPAGSAAALVDAAGEALTNVAKHSGTAEAMMRASVGDRELTVSILDRGCGFDPAKVTRGMGLEESIGNRIRDVGGSVSVDSSAGGGTYIELTVPLL